MCVRVAVCLIQRHYSIAALCGCLALRRLQGGSGGCVTQGSARFICGWCGCGVVRRRVVDCWQRWLVLQYSKASSCVAAGSGLVATAGSSGSLS